MANVTIYKDADVTINVIDGPPPADQSAQIAALTTQLAAMTSAHDALQAKLTTVSADLDRAKVDAA